MPHHLTVNRRKHLMALDPVERGCACSFAESLELELATDWLTFCAMRAKCFHEFWTEMAKHPPQHRHAARPAAQLARLRAKAAKLEEELRCG